MSELKAGAGGMREIHSALAESRRFFVAFGLFSAFVNLLSPAMDPGIRSSLDTTELLAQIQGIN